MKVEPLPSSLDGSLSYLRLQWWVMILNYYYYYYYYYCYYYYDTKYDHRQATKSTYQCLVDEQDFVAAATVGDD